MTHQLFEDMIVAHATPSTRMDAYKREGRSWFGLRPVNLYSSLNLTRIRSDEFSFFEPQTPTPNQRAFIVFFR